MSILRKIREVISETNKIVTDNRKFWKTVNPLSSGKVSHKECIKLKDSNNKITNNEEIAETFKTFFGKIVPNLNLRKSKSF